MNDPIQPYRENSNLRHSYSVIAPVYDLLVSGPLKEARRRSLESLPSDFPGHVLLSGVGTGLDIPLLPRMHRYTALDFNAGMVARAKGRARDLEVSWVLGDSMELPFGDAQFDHVVLHLIVAVVPDPALCLSESARVLKHGGTVIIFDKFLRPEQAAWFRRALNPLASRLATRLDVVFERELEKVPQLRVLCDRPSLGKGWFRRIVLEKI